MSTLHGLGTVVLFLAYLEAPHSIIVKNKNQYYTGVDPKHNVPTVQPNLTVHLNGLLRAAALSSMGSTAGHMGSRPELQAQAKA